MFIKLENFASSILELVDLQFSHLITCVLECSSYLTNSFPVRKKYGCITVNDFIPYLGKIVQHLFVSLRVCYLHILILMSVLRDPFTYLYAFDQSLE